LRQGIRYNKSVPATWRNQFAPAKAFSQFRDKAFVTTKAFPQLGDNQFAPAKPFPLFCDKAFATTKPFPQFCGSKMYFFATIIARRAYLPNSFIPH
jgi:hypothetical protein